ncbi:OTU protein [Cytospora paraplurivora]|uniref:OTU protein n=1 Tax=Cytospora paraplurivora TaxID=2898453 RepID=A0AAN9U3Q0_9PEZI
MDGASSTPSETLEQAQSRHRKEAKDLQGRITNKKKNATKKTRKGVNDECAEMERQMRDRHAEELRRISGEAGGDDDDDDNNETRIPDNEDDAPEDGVDVAAFAEKMKALGVEDLAARPPQRPTSEKDEDISSGGNGGGAGGGGGAGKKRNRQKERLARRAAEQEAAAVAAEREASGMTDRRGAERERMQGAFGRNGLVEREIRPDGHCLFSAVADQLQQRGVPLGGEGEGEGEAEPGYRTVRRRAAGYIGEHGDDFAGFLEEDLESYVRKMRDTAEWGGQLELLAVANVYGVEIHVVQDGQTEVIRPTEATATGGEDEKKRIWLAYYRHGYGLGEHYNSLRTKA